MTLEDVFVRLTRHDESLALERSAPRPPPGDPRAAVERVLTERGLRTPTTQIDAKDGRVRVVLDAVAFPALMSALGSLARDDDAGFMNKVAVTLNPPPKKPPPEKPEKKDQDGI